MKAEYLWLSAQIFLNQTSCEPLLSRLLKKIQANMDSHKREWFAERAKVLEYYANNIPDNTDDVKIIFHKPESGWIDTDVVVNNSDTFQFPISYAYPPFEDLIKWLENLAVNRYFVDNVSSFSICINSEDIYFILVYEPDFYSRRNDVGIFYVFADDCIGGIWTRKVVLHAYCCKTDLIRNFYNSLTELARFLKNNPEDDNGWVFEWVDDRDDDNIDYLERFNSPIINDYLSSKSACSVDGGI